MPSKRTPAQPASIHRLKITPRHFEPAIWRTVAVPSDFTLGDCHHVIQYAMGWEHAHMHDFRIGKVTYVDPRMPVNEDDQDEDQVTLAQVVPRARRKMRYTYDFGDNWEHDVQVEAVEPPDPALRYPVILDGAQACPRRIAAASGAMPACWRCCPIPTILTTRRCWSGSKSRSILTSSI